MKKWPRTRPITASTLVTVRTHFRENPLHRFLLLAAAAIVTVLVAAFDYSSGSAVETAPLFLIPTVVVATLIGTSHGLVFAASDVALDSYDVIYPQGAPASLVEALTGIALRIVLYLTVAYLVGRVTSIAEENESIAGRLQQSMDTINSEISSAAKLQSVLITGATPTVPYLDVAARISCAEMVGGDFLDVKNAHGVLHLCIGDISGKGIRAALFAATLKYLVLQAVDSALSPADTLRFLNKELADFLPDQMFVTMVCGEIDGATGSLVYASAGHEIQFLLRKNGSVELLQPTGTILALRSDIDIQEQRLQLEIGDTALFYTDGALDVQTPSGRLALDGLRDLFVSKADGNARTTVDGLFEALVSNVNRHDRDDITLLVVTRHSHAD
jgi:serine phosphatase RsbU (regulator of sigma subunit)